MGSKIRDRAEKKHRDSHPEWDFIAWGQRSETELRRSTGTHTLDGISWHEVRIRNRAEEKHRHSHSKWDFMTWGQRSETELRRSTGTHTLEGISWQEIRDKRQS